MNIILVDKMQGQSSDKSDRNDQTFGHLIILLIFLSNEKQVCNRKIMTKQAGAELCQAGEKLGLAKPGLPSQKLWSH